MTVTGQLNKITYTGNGVTTAFPFNNVLYTEGAIAVILTDGNGVDTLQVNPTNYSVVLAGDFSTATINMVVPPLGAGGSGPAAEILTIYRVEPDTQTLDYVEGGPFPSQSTEIALDKATLESQTQAEQLLRAIKMPVTTLDSSSAAFDGEVTNKPTAIQQYFQFNATLGTMEMVNPVNDQDAIGSISTADEFLLSDADDNNLLKKGTIAQLMLSMGSGDVVGPAGAADSNLAAFDGVTGKLIKDGAVSTADVVANNAKVTNATHTGEVTGATALTVDPTAISNKTLVTLDNADHLLIEDATDGLLKKIIASDISGDVVGPASSTDNAITRFNGATGKIIQDYTSDAPTVSDVGLLNTVRIPTLTQTNQTGNFTASTDNYYTASGASNILASLDSASGFEDRRVAITCEEDYTGTLTVSPAGSDTVNSFSSWIMFAGESVVIESDGTDDWRIVAVNRIPTFVSADSNAGQVLTANVTNMQYEDNITDVRGTWTGNNTFNPPRDGVYIISTAFSTTSATASESQLYVNGAALNISGHTGDINGGTKTLSTEINLSAGDTVNIRCTGSFTRSASSFRNWLSITENT